MHKRLLLVAALTLASSARADVPPPNMEGCYSQEPGAKCKTDSGGDGTCQKQTCSRLDYSKGVPPGSIDYDCLLCIAGPATPPASTPAKSNAPAPTTPATATPATAAKGNSCSAMPGESLGLLVLVAGWLARRRNRNA
jgi:MYXO-CTERM domain-containing protein